MKLLLDTNVLIDYFAVREPFFQDALKLRIAQEFGDVELWACTQSYLDILYILGGAIPKDKLVSQLLASCEFIKLATPDGDDLRLCLESPWKDIEDQMIECGAQRAQVNYLCTRNVDDFSRSKLAVRTPAQILEELENEGLSYDVGIMS